MADIPSYDAVVNYARERGFISDPAEFWARYQKNGWKKDGRPVYNWRALFQAWEREERKKLKPPAPLIQEPADGDGEWGTDEERAELIAEIERKLAIMEEQKAAYRMSLEEKRRQRQ